MVHVVNLDQYIEVKEDIDRGMAVFLFEEEMARLGDEHSWLGHLKAEVYLVKMDQEDFRAMDLATHPHTILIRDGEEVKTINGIPTEDYLGEYL